MGIRTGMGWLLALVFIFTVGATAQENSASDKFYFVQISDTHIKDATSLERLSKIVDQVNNLPLPIEFVIHTGDIFNQVPDEEQVKSCLSVLQTLKMPLHTVAGNHDIRADNTQTYQENFGDLQTEFECRGVVFLTLCTEGLREGYTTGETDPLESLREALQKHKRKPVVLFHHSPFTDLFYSKEIVKKWGDILQGSSVKAVIAGHTHSDAFLWSGLVPIYIASCAADSEGRQANYRIYEYNKKKISYFTKYVN